ncbi:Panacea domain-containing protein [Bifidobacterium pseudocatenulatum]|uniref:Panacea domain-containing protein n=1 Tax=Bifidobacterium pseudocatenulatum TaxID=28026 RepID=UPI001D029B5E|nr:type II toxin-antitoxin system antitoxin SocA domain-containing protein [Bifidobacterium pseudocatenulatum]UDG87363.1 DUF4065 domain-containing protein [Bifidobacterium pseudocatenulatum]
MSKPQRDSLSGTGADPKLVANSILRRAFAEQIAVSPMKLQKLMFFITCLYQRNTCHRLLTESFQPWQYGPVCGTVYGEFASFGGNPITAYAKDAIGDAYAADERSSPELKQAIDTVWDRMKYLSAVTLSRITVLPGSAWSKAVERKNCFISNADMAEDHTFDACLIMNVSAGR